MGFREITELRKSGNLSAALTLALKEFASAPDDSYIKSALAWVYRDMLKALEDANRFNEFSKVFNNLLALEIDLKYENYMGPALRWHINKLGWKLIEADKRKTYRLKQLLELAIKVPAVNSNENSLLVKMFIKAFKDDRNCYFQLVNWQGFDNFVQNSEQDDYASEVYNDREMLSLVESYFGTYCKHLLPENFNGQVMFDVNRVDEFIPHCAKLISKHPEYKWLPYYLAQLQSARGIRHEALKTILPFVRTHRNDFWAWERLGDFLADPKDKLSCYCKGAQCKNKAEMLIGLRKKLIPFFIEYSELGAAKYEIEQIINIRNRQEWTVPQEFIEWQNADWFSSSESRINNVSTYEKYSVNAEELLYGDIDLQDVLIVWKDDQKQLAGFLANDEKCGTGIFRGDNVNNLDRYNVYRVKLLVNNKGTLEPLTKPLLVVNHSFREKHIMKKNIIILWVDREKNLAGFLIEGNIKASTNSGVLRGDDSREVIIYDTYSVEVMKNQKGDYEVISKPIKIEDERFRSKYVTKKNIFILWVDREKNLAGFLIEDDIKTSTASGVLRGVDSHGVIAHGTYSVEVIKNQKGEYEATSKPIKIENESFRSKYIMKKNIIILWVDREKNLAGFLIEDDIKTSTNSGVLRGDFSREVVAYDTYSLEVTKNQKGEYEAISKPLKNINEKLRNKFVEPIEGSVRISEGKKFGFISDFYISPLLVQKYLLHNGNKVKGFIVRNWNAKEKVWSWQLGDIDGTQIR